MSNYLNYSVQTRQDLKDWILRQLGHPLITVELTNEHLDDCINNAVEEFTKYAGQDQDYLAINLSGYTPSGILLPDNVTGIFNIDEGNTSLRGGITELFTIPNQMLNAGSLVIPVPGEAYGWLNYELALQYLELTKRMLGGGFQFEFNPRTHFLTLYPDPIKEKIEGWIVVSVNKIRDDVYQYGESWVKRYSLAQAKILLNQIRGKYNGVQLLGGGSLNQSLYNNAESEAENLRKELLEKESGILTFWVG